jgi:superfamily II DNA or RNA helicase
MVQIASIPDHHSLRGKHHDGLRQLGKNTKQSLDSLISGLSVEPRAYQQRIIGSAIKMFAGTWLGRERTLAPAAASVLIESPTGSGKTVMGLSTAALLQRATGCRVGWVAMRRNLLSQAADENRRRGFNVEMELISMFDRNPPQVDLLVVDEAQHDAATSMANLHSQVRPKWTLGLSATPYRSDRIKLCFDQVIRDAGISQLIADGYLAPYRHFTIAEYTPVTVAGMLVEEPERWGQSLVFFHTREQCAQCESLLRENNIACDVVTATTHREAQLDAFERGQTHVLINMAILTEGFDCPSLKTVFCRPSGKGCTIQMAGRVLRKCAGMPLKQIVQCRRTPHPMLKTAMAAEQFLWTPDGWRSIKANEQLDALTQAARQTIAQTNVQIPKLVSMHRLRSSRWLRRGEDGI